MGKPQCTPDPFVVVEAFNEIIEHNLTTEDGYLLRPDAPGLGVDPNEKVDSRLSQSASDPPHWRRPDGSVQDG